MAASSDNIVIPAYRGHDPYIFVSYAHTDSALVLSEIKRLNDAGYNIWYDEGILYGSGWSPEIPEAIRNCSAFVVMVTPNSINSRNVQKEIDFALSIQRPLIMVYLQETEFPASMRLQLSLSRGIHKYNISDTEYDHKLHSSLGEIGLTSQMRAPVQSSAPIIDPTYACQQFAQIPEQNTAQPIDSNTAPMAAKENKRKGLWAFLSKSRKKAPQPAEITEVQFSALAPETLKRSEYSVIEIMMYEKEFRYMVDEVIAQAKAPVKETKSGFLHAARNTEIRVEIYSPDLTIDDNAQTQRWTGSLLRFQYAVKLPENCDKNQILFNADVYFNGVITTKLKFTVYCETNSRQNPSVSRCDIMSAFVSYSSLDRKRVASIVQGLRKARPDLDIFFDIDSLRSGENWEKTLTKEIDNRDILYLCWSVNASNSEWVDYEWRYAYDSKGIERIEPIPLEPPEKCPPPKELNTKHFNDRLLYMINS